MIHLGTTLLENNNLLLRQFELNDAKSMHENWDNKKFPTCKTLNDINDTTELLKIWCNDYDKLDNYNWAVILKETNKLIGSVSVINITKENLTECDLWFCFSSNFFGEEIATQTLQIVFDYLFNKVGFDNINCFNLVENNSFTKVLENLNMSYNGIVQNKFKNNIDENVDYNSYSIKKEQFNLVTVRKAYEYEVLIVNDIYNDIVTHLENTTNFCGWKHGIYPTLDVAQKAYSKGELFVAIQSGHVIGTCVLNNAQAIQYYDIDWKIKDDKPLVVHTVAINPKNLRQGVAHKLLDFSKAYAKELNLLTIRLDASEPNVPARKIYEDAGFIKRGEMDLLTNRGGINNWFAYEFIIN